MATARVIMSGLLVWFVSLTGPSQAGPIPAPLKGVTISTRVTQDNSIGIFRYQYQVNNPAANDGEIWSVDIEITRSSPDIALSGGGLVNGPRYMAHISEDAFRTVPMVPVGVAGPDEWIYALGFDSAARTGFVGWGSTEATRILPGQVMEGFQLTSRGLPGIRKVEIQPNIDYDNLPDEFTDVEKARQLRDSLIFRTVAVGPKAPPKSFVPVEFLNYLISLLHQSRVNGWITRDGAHQSLLAKLINAERKLEAGDVAVAKNVLVAFLNEVRATSCPEFDCPGNKPLTSEGYALLFFNGQFLVERLP